MSITLKAKGFQIQGNSFLVKNLIFLDSILRGIGQVMFQNNSYTGIVFLIGIFYNSTLFGLAALFGTIISTMTAYGLRADRFQIQNGLFGFNGALTAIGLLFFLEPNALTWVYVIVAAMASTVLTSALAQLLKLLKLPTLTAPFVITTLIFLMACARFGRLQTTQLLPNAGLPTLAHVEGVVSATTLTEGLIKGVSQVFFQENIITGILFLIGLILNSRRCFTMAIIGSIMGLLTAWLLGASEPAMRSGAFGFNSVLTAIALGSIFLRPSVSSFLYTLLGTTITTVAFAAISGTFEPIGMPAMTLPFVIITWVFLLTNKENNKTE